MGCNVSNAAAQTDKYPLCVNAAAVHSYLLRITKETKWVLAGRTQAQMTESITASIAKKELPVMDPARCATCYRSKDTRVTAAPTGLPTSCFSIRPPTRNLGSESAGFSRRWCERSHGAPDAVRHSHTKVVRWKEWSLTRTVHSADKR
jgi:hypothetical protein